MGRLPLLVRASAWWSPPAVVDGLPPGRPDVVGSPGVGLDQAAVPQGAIGGAGIGGGGVTGVHAVAEEVAVHVGHERAVALG